MLTVDFNKLDLAPGTMVLDAGCGSGRHLCEAFRRPGVGVVGIDMKWEDLCQARGYLSMMGGENAGPWLVVKGDVTRLPFADGTFDVVLCSEVLEHITDGKAAVREIVRILKPGGDLVVSVPRYLPERICWLLSRPYHEEPGGHVRIYKHEELRRLLEDAGASLWSVRYRHALHVPYWWLKCLVGHKNERFPLVKLYRRFLEWDIMNHPAAVRTLERLLDPLLAKSVVFYLKKGN